MLLRIFLACLSNLNSLYLNTRCLDLLGVTLFKFRFNFRLFLSRAELFLCCLCFFSVMARADDSQNSQKDKVGLGPMFETRKEVILGNGDRAFVDRDGRDLNLGGYERSPILFDPLQDDNRSRVYPQLTAQREYSRGEGNGLYRSTICRYANIFPVELKESIERSCNGNGASTEPSEGVGLVVKKFTNNMLMTNLMVDDEIHKAEMGVFWDPSYVKGEYLEDDVQYNSVLMQTMTTPFGVGGMALDFLDKAVAASSVATRLAADNNTMLQFIRQVNLNTSQIANPERVQLYKDHAEKFEACMYSKGDERVLERADGKNGRPMFKHVRFTLPSGRSCLASDHNDCRSFYSGTAAGDQYGFVKKNKGLYQFCMCCADRALEVNDSSVGKVKVTGNEVKDGYRRNLCSEYVRRMVSSGYKENDIQGDLSGGEDAFGNHSYSLVERVFMGLSYEEDNKTFNSNLSGSFDSSEKLKAIVSNFAHFFQDIYGDVCMYETKGDKDTPGFIRKQFVSPFWSVPQLVDLMRNGRPDEACDRATQYCPITQQDVNVGICPAFKLLVALEYKGDLHKIMVGETSETGITKSEVEGYWVQATLGDTLTARDFQNVVRDFQRHPEFNRFIETFCDASAGAAVKKLHTRMLSIALDHLLLNQKITDEDRKMVRRLMDRVSEYLTLAAQDSSSMANSMIIANEVQRNRLDQADRGSFIASALGASRNSAQLDELDAPFGGASPRSAVNANP